ncbi:MAG: efflux RND transporter periplasmic adaptor subunit [Planctomycetes bacterium]|nr:efflux RND transporter periplasmic adaptor subunit [Planctomycetota bacterium]
MTNTDHVQRGTARRLGSLILRGVLPFVVVLAGVFGAVRLIQTAPQAKQRAPRQSATLVETRAVQSTSQRVVIDAMGTVVAAKEIVLQPQVSGVIQELHPALVPGGQIRAGEQIVKIDPADYEVAVRQAEATLARAKAQFRSAEFELQRVTGLQEQEASNAKELHDVWTTHAAVGADVAAAQASLEKAQLDLARTVIRAPFSCAVTAESVDVGALVTPQARLASLVGTDEFWVRVSVPVEQLRWIRIPGDGEESGSPARIHQRLGTSASAEWSGYVVRLLSDLEPQGRMARLLVSVPQPLGDGGKRSDRPLLLLGSYVDVQIEGRELDEVFRLTRDELHDGEAVWLMNENDVLDIRTVEVVFRGRNYVLVGRGLSAGQRLITSDLPSPVRGMALREGRSGGTAIGVAEVDVDDAEHEGEPR